MRLGEAAVYKAWNFGISRVINPQVMLINVELVMYLHPIEVMSVRSITEETNQLSLQLLETTDSYVRGETEGAFVVVWHLAPTVETIEKAIAPLLARFDACKDARQPILIVSTAKNSPSKAANQYAEKIAIKYARHLKPVAIVEMAGGLTSHVNRIALRMVLASVSALGLMPAVGLFGKLKEGTEWLSKNAAAHGLHVDAEKLSQAVNRLMLRKT